MRKRHFGKEDACPNSRGTPKIGVSMIMRERPEKGDSKIDGVIEGLGMVVDFGDAKDKLNKAIARQTIDIDSSIREMRMRIAEGICNIGREC